MKSPPDNLQECVDCRQILPTFEFHKSGSNKPKKYCKHCSNLRKRKARKYNQALNILFISDVHLPYGHPDALDFLKEIQTVYKLKRVICLGDLFDFQAISRWGADPRLSSALDEYGRALQQAAAFYKAFPECDYILGNHDLRPKNSALKNGIPDYFMKDEKMLMRLPEAWTVQHDMIIEQKDDTPIYVHHGHGKNKSALKTAQLEMANFVCGHHHNDLAVQYQHSRRGRIWGMNTGCLVDLENLAFMYGKNYSKRPALGTGIITNNIPVVVPMRLDKHDRWTGKL